MSQEQLIASPPAHSAPLRLSDSPPTRRSDVEWDEIRPPHAANSVAPSRKRSKRDIVAIVETLSRTGAGQDGSRAKDTFLDYWCERRVAAARSRKQSVGSSNGSPAPSTASKIATPCRTRSRTRAALTDLQSLVSRLASGLQQDDEPAEQENCAAQSYTATASCAASSPVRREVTGTKPAAASLDDSFDLDDELTQEIFEVLSQFDAPSLPPTALASAGRAAMSKATQPVASAAGASSYCASPLSRNTTPLRPQPQTQRRTPEYRRQQTYTVAASPLLPANRATTLTLPQPAPTTTTHANPQPQPAQPPQQPPPQEAVSPAPQRCASGGSSTVTDSQGSDAGGGSQGDGGIRRKYTASEIEQKRKLARAKSNRRRAQMLLQQRRAASAGGNVPPAAQSAPAAMHRAASTAGLTDSQRAALVSAGAIPNAAALMATSHQHHCPAAKRFAPEKVG